ncbi:unnamed protein product [Rangifer tarandus platyrhynchus]|uniref:Uncharacterized protein n=2 Tax=Rangifer tarandus platyrhynchus TaxID=3082113 RepID=A0ABN8Z5C8_RANTA|nr:unnamed protein product [Rangifer tarandus platyrhynchus]
MSKGARTQVYAGSGEPSGMVGHAEASSGQEPWLSRGSSWDLQPQWTGRQPHGWPAGMRPRSSGRAGKGNPTSPPTAHLPLPPPAVPAGTPEPAGTPLSGSLERQEAGIRASPRRRQTRPGEKGAEAQPIWGHAGRSPQPPSPSVFCLSSAGGRP